MRMANIISYLARNGERLKILGAIHKVRRPDVIDPDALDLSQALVDGEGAALGRGGRG